MSPPELLVPTAGLAPLTPRCPARPVPPRPWLMTTVSCHSDGRDIRIFTPLRPVLPCAERPPAPAAVAPPAPVETPAKPPEEVSSSGISPPAGDEGAGAGAAPPPPESTSSNSPRWAERVEDRELEARTCPVPLIAARATRLRCPHRRRPVPPDQPVRHFNPGMSSWLYAT